jgi:hypothetical protein
MSAVKIDWKNSHAGMKRQISDYGFEVSHLASQRARAFWENERVVASIQKRPCMPERLA